MSFEKDKDIQEKKYINKFLLIACFAVAHSLEATYAASMPSISNSLGVPSNFAQYLSVSGFIGFSLGILILGRISDLLGRRNTMIAGLAIYNTFSVLSLFISSIDTLIAFRFMQSFGVSVGSVVAQAIMRDVFHGRSLSKMYSIVTAGLAFIPSLSAGFGGFIASTFQWKYNLVFLFISGIMTMFAVVRMLPETHPKDSSKHISYIKILSRVVRDKNIWICILVIGSSNSILFGFFIEAPFIVMKKFMLSAYHYAMIMIIITTPLFLSSIINSKLSKIIEPEFITRLGSKLSLASGISILVIGLLDEYIGTKVFMVLTVFSRMIFAVSHGLIVPHFMRSALENYAGVNGTAGAIFGFTYYMFVAINNACIAHFHSDKTILPAAVQFLILSFIIFTTINYKPTTQQQE